MKGEGEQHRERGEDDDEDDGLADAEERTGGNDPLAQTHNLDIAECEESTESTTNNAEDDRREEGENV